MSHDANSSIASMACCSVSCKKKRTKKLVFQVKSGHDTAHFMASPVTIQRVCRTNQAKVYHKFHVKLSATILHVTGSGKGKK